MPSAAITTNLLLSAERLLALATDIGGGGSASANLIRFTCRDFEAAVENVRLSCFGLIEAEPDPADVEDPAELVGWLLARSDDNERELPNLRAEDDTSYSRAVGRR